MIIEYKQGAGILKPKDNSFPKHWFQHTNFMLQREEKHNV